MYLFRILTQMFRNVYKNKSNSNIKSKINKSKISGIFIYYYLFVLFIFHKYKKLLNKIKKL